MDIVKNYTLFLITLLLLGSGLQSSALVSQPSQSTGAVVGTGYPTDDPLLPSISPEPRTEYVATTTDRSGNEHPVPKVDNSKASSVVMEGRDSIPDDAPQFLKDMDADAKGLPEISRDVLRKGVLYQSSDFTVNEINVLPLNYTVSNSYEALRIIISYTAGTCNVIARGSLYADQPLASAVGVSSMSSIILDFDGADIWNKTTEQTWSVSLDFSLYCGTFSQFTLDVVLDGTYSSLDFNAPGVDLLSLDTNVMDVDADSIADGLVYNFTLSSPIRSYEIISFDPYGGMRQVTDKDEVPFGSLNGSSVTSILRVETSYKSFKLFDLGETNMTTWEAGSSGFGMRDFSFTPVDTDGDGRYNLLSIEFFADVLDPKNTMFWIQTLIAGTQQVLSTSFADTPMSGTVKVVRELNMYDSVDVSIQIVGGVDGEIELYIISTFSTSGFEEPPGEFRDVKVESLAGLDILTFKFTSKSQGYFFLFADVYTAEGVLITTLVDTKTYEASKAGTEMYGSLRLSSAMAYSGVATIVLTAVSSMSLLSTGSQLYFTTTVDLTIDLSTTDGMTADVTVSDIFRGGELYAKEIRVTGTLSASSQFSISLYSPSSELETFFVYSYGQEGETYDESLYITIGQIINSGFQEGFVLEIVDFQEGSGRTRLKTPIDFKLTPRDLGIVETMDITSSLQSDSSNVDITINLAYNFTFATDVSISVGMNFEFEYTDTVLIGDGNLEFTFSQQRYNLGRITPAYVSISLSYLYWDTFIDKTLQIDTSSLVLNATAVSLSADVSPSELSVDVNVDAYVSSRFFFVTYVIDELGTVVGPWNPAEQATLTSGDSYTLSQTIRSTQLYRAQQNSKLYLIAEVCTEDAFWQDNCQIAWMEVPTLPEPSVYVNLNTLSPIFENTDDDPRYDMSIYKIPVKIDEVGQYFLDLYISTGLDLIAYQSKSVDGPYTGDVTFTVPAKQLAEWGSVEYLETFVVLVNIETGEQIEEFSPRFTPTDLEDLQGSPIQITWVNLDTVTLVSEGRWGVDVTLDVSSLDSVNEGVIFAVRPVYVGGFGGILGEHDTQYVTGLTLGTQTIRVEFTDRSGLFPSDYDYIYVDDVFVISPTEGRLSRYSSSSYSHEYGSSYTPNPISQISTVGISDYVQQGNYLDYTSYYMDPTGNIDSDDRVSYEVLSITGNNLRVRKSSAFGEEIIDYSVNDRADTTSPGNYLDFMLDPSEIKAGTWIRVGEDDMYVGEKVMITVGENEYLVWALEGENQILFFDSQTGVFLKSVATFLAINEITYSNISDLDLPENPYFTGTTSTPTMVSTSTTTVDQSTTEDSPLLFSTMMLALALIALRRRLSSSRKSN